MKETMMVGWFLFCAVMSVAWIGFVVWAVYSVVTWLVTQ